MPKMTRAGKLFTTTIIVLSCFTPMGFHTFSLLAVVMYLMGDRKRKKLLSLLFKDG